MKSLKLEFGSELKSLLKEPTDILLISKWAYKKYIDNRNLDKCLKEILITLSFMEDDPQFELSDKQLSDIAEKLIQEGEQEEFGKPLLDVKEKATCLEDNWIMCPLCQEAWETLSKYPMIRCPKCENLLHNPLSAPFEL